jgi:hypothetical protein
MIFYLLFILSIGEQTINGSIPFESEESCKKAKTALEVHIKGIGMITGMPISEESRVWCIENK